MEMKKKSWSSKTHIGKNGLENKDCYKRQRRTLHSAHDINPRRKYNNCKYIYASNIRAPQYMKLMLTVIKGEINYVTNTGGL